MSSVPDLAAFQEETFDPKKWINNACDMKPPDEAVERSAHSSEPDIKLHPLESIGALRY